MSMVAPPRGHKSGSWREVMLFRFAADFSVGSQRTLIILNLMLYMIGFDSECFRWCFQAPNPRMYPKNISCFDAVRVSSVL